MSATSSQPMTDSKSAKKRKTKAVPATAPPAGTSTQAQINGTADHDGEAGYLKELAKQIRNNQKKLNAIAKTETTVAEFPQTSLDDLVKQKKINADQKVQIEKKPQIQAHLQQLEEQQKQFTEFADSLQAQHEKEKTRLAEQHDAELEKAREEATQNSTTTTSEKVRDALQTACTFLHAAAFQRQKDDVEEAEKAAYEAALFYLYQGNSTAIATLTNIVEGNDIKVLEPTNGEEIDFTFTQLKASALSQGNQSSADIEPATEGETEAMAAADAEETETDPTIANAGLTELEDTTAVPTSATNDAVAEDVTQTEAPEQIATGEAGNAMAESSWNAEASMTTEATQTGEDFVLVDRNPNETESSHTPAAQQSTSNWADEAGAAAEEKAALPVAEGDGFSEVRRDRGGRGRGGRGGRGYEGRGRGRGRGEGRGEYRGNRGGRGRGAPRGAPQAQAS